MTLFALLHWVGEPNYDVYDVQKIADPRKPDDDYEIGEMVKARWGKAKKPYSAIIEGLSGKSTFL